jgi:hypothetical protein
VLSNCASGTGVALTAVATAAPEPPTVSSVAASRPDPEKEACHAFWHGNHGFEVPPKSSLDDAREA